MLTFTFSLMWFALSAPTPPPAFDEARAKAHYESFVYDFLKRDWPANDDSVNHMKASEKRPRPVVVADPWPIDPARGFYCNSAQRLTRFNWTAVGQTQPPDGRPFYNLDLCSLSRMSSSYMYDFTNDVAPDLCVERPGTTAAFQGAAACYFAVRTAEYSTSGFWVALREVDGKVVIAGILEHKEFLDEPEKDRRLKPFLDAIEKRFGPQPEPKAPKPSKRP